MFQDPMLQSLDSPFLCGLRRKMCADLRLAARPLQEDDQPARD